MREGGEGKKEPDGVIRVYARKGGFAGLYEYDGEKRRKKEIKQGISDLNAYDRWLDEMAEKYQQK